MANLVPLFLDKDTGKIVAKDSSISGGIFQAIGYSHIQTIASTVWTIYHNGGTMFVMTQIFDTNDLQVIPSEIETVDMDTVEVTFNTPQTGKALLVLFQPV